ncbi:uncharacterized protein LOC143686924 [Tamandua tetradactyla]|uniref:uncharacterized protein LOC143686924 n=1 Tax=Tamandua tetradactyla TaxID=48850 RepID=UPI00405465D8
MELTRVDAESQTQALGIEPGSLARQMRTLPAEPPWPTQDKVILKGKVMKSQVENAMEEQEKNQGDRIRGYSNSSGGRRELRQNPMISCQTVASTAYKKKNTKNKRLWLQDTLK